ncbi:DUF1501 domain-containing protein [Shewanella sp. 202IG2-18]|uniref:DUF1501 domain-containing protein n=1 Tax=Parashewanella hymeniacidonis TaxID=2807618 RepID=UPI001960C4F2|nr:DUF1501 domain-containing protein [Parashewanella hymeniacidonis]MBM7071995.1 DUF1501 domain-containing protein [Parashewanella hymeniacidonis]
MKRRNFIKLMGGAIVLFQSPKLVFAKNQDNPNRPLFIWVIMRGALDSLHTVIPESDDNYKAFRPNLAQQIQQPTLPLSQGFTLNPALKNLHTWYQNKELLPIVAVGSGYPSRSHFDGQDYLESGTGTQNTKTGWLARALNQKKTDAIAIDYSTPVSLRGSSAVNSWYPAKLKSADDDIYQTLKSLYQDDNSLLANLNHGVEIKNKTQSLDKQKGRSSFSTLTRGCAKLLSQSPDMDCAMLEIGGWDTHNAQQPRLKKQLTELDQGLAELKASLGPLWKNTVVALATEFGRTVRENGTGGTDHGTGSVMFLAGGGVKGGNIQGKWPGLKPEQLFENRDLMPTTNTFSWIATALSQHWQLSTDNIKNVFPKQKIYSTHIIRNT